MDIFKLLGTFAIDTSELDAAETRTTEFGTKVKNGFATVGKVAVAAIGAAATAVAALTKSAVSNFADYEQLVGGVETLFGDSSDYVVRRAKNAYETAGLSANEYMETVTSFSASLLQGLGGDTEKAAKIADQAIIAMSDNANKMGTSMEMIQNAYQGFAKQNYTMLDNLKLGYGGTASEMARLINDSGVLGDSIEVTAETVNDVSFDKIIEAIQVVQDEMGITGTTAKEASETIAGSIGMAKSAWQNFLTAVADPNSGDYFYETINSLVDSVVTVADNIIPVLVQAVPKLVEGLMQMANELAVYLPEIIGSLLPALISGAASLVRTLIEGIPDLLAELGPVVISSLQTLLDSVTEYFGIASFDISSAISEISAFFQDAWIVCQEIWASIGQPIFDLVLSLVESVRLAFSEKMPEIKEFVSSCFTDIQNFWDNNLKPCFEAIGDFISNVLAPVFTFVFENTIGPAVNSAFQFIKDLWENTLKPIFTGITDFLTGVFTGNWEQAFSGIVSIVEGIWNGLVSVVKAPINQVIGLINSFIGGLNNLQVPDWVPLIGGKGINIPLIPYLEQGGVLEKGQVGFLEGNGAEAVVPLHQNKAWISAVAKDMDSAIGGDKEMLQKIVDLLEMLIDVLPESMKEALDGTAFTINNREFARLVKGV